MNTETSSEIDYRWQCRRGMLELDLLLNNFVEKKIDLLDEQQRQTFELLLSYPDQTLFDLLLGEAVSSDTMISNMIQDIRLTSF
jgi:antitoxin CptB